MTRSRRSQLRLRLTAASFLLSLLIVSGSVVALVAILRDEAAQTITTRLDDRATALAATVVDRRGQVDVIGADEALFDGPNWVYDATGAQLEGATSNGSLAPALRSLATTRTAHTVTAGAWHLRALPVSGRSGTIAVVVTGVNDGPYSATLDFIVRAAVLLGLLAVLGATGLAALVLSRALGPIAVMTEQAAGWSRARSDGRFALGPPKDEVGQLAAVLDDLLDRVDAALEAERRLTAEIAHELRTPLTVLTGEAQLALMNPDTPPDQRSRYERIELAAQGMARAITTLLADATAHAERDSVADPRTVVERLVPTLDFAGTIEIEGVAPSAAVPAGTLERMLAPVLGNAASMAVSTIRIRLAAEGASVTIGVVDDGPGVDRAVQDTLFTPGVSGRVGGTGLGLPLARRLARDVGGDVTLVRARPATFAVRLPVVDPVNVQ